ncbi:hypothetical protein C8R43DRAFT_1020364 [Mycena crocata]|nr:hypothetical protein C8R43DRAFT_1020364 [Mycena crocata]
MSFVNCRRLSRSVSFSLPIYKFLVRRVDPYPVRPVPAHAHLNKELCLPLFISSASLPSWLLCFAFLVALVRFNSLPASSLARHSTASTQDPRTLPSKPTSPVWPNPARGNFASSERHISQKFARETSETEVLLVDSSDVVHSAPLLPVTNGRGKFSQVNGVRLPASQYSVTASWPFYQQIFIA